MDVETFYLLRAIQRYNAKHPMSKVKVDCGCFISDYVGEQALREYSKVYFKYDNVLSNFLYQTLK